jgi:hypothetical protein
MYRSRIWVSRVFCSPAAAGSLLPSSIIRPLDPNLFPFNKLQKILDIDVTFAVTYLVSSTLQVAFLLPLVPSPLLYFVSSS